MPEQEVIERAREDARRGKSPSTQAGEFVREEFHHVRQGKHGARSSRQAIAIGLSKARRAGLNLPPPRNGSVSEKVRKQVQRDFVRGQQEPARKPNRTRSRAVFRVLRRESRPAASTRALSRQSRRGARSRTAGERSTAAHRAARTRMAA